MIFLRTLWCAPGEDTEIMLIDDDDTIIKLTREDAEEILEEAQDAILEAGEIMSQLYPLLRSEGIQFYIPEN